MAGVRERGQPGTAPEPRSGNTGGGGRDGADGGPAAGDGALAWSVAAMTDALHRLARAGASDVPLAVAAATEAVWWVTAVDAAMSRRHPGAYRRALAALDPAARRSVEGSLAGFRFIRGQLGYSADPGEFIQPAPGDRPAAGGPGAPSPRRPRSADPRGTSARTGSTGRSWPAGPSQRSSDGPRASSATLTPPRPATNTAGLHPRRRPRLACRRER
jgi:hypothetical protein